MFWWNGTGTGNQTFHEVHDPNPVDREANEVKINAAFSSWLAVVSFKLKASVFPGSP
jgi:hypothetical protein